VLTRDILIVASILLVCISAGRAWADGDTVATRYALGGDFGVTYDPGNEINFALLSGVALFDYDRVWPHRAPEPLRFKVEGSAGVTTSPRTRAMLSANMLALFFLHDLDTARLRPYVEAGIGLIYTDFQVAGQGLRFNFNPQAGVGTEFDLGGHGWFAAFRFHHLSNGKIYHENRGINSVLFQVGRFFGP